MTPASPLQDNYSGNDLDLLQLASFHYSIFRKGGRLPGIGFDGFFRAYLAHQESFEAVQLLDVAYSAIYSMPTVWCISI